MSPPRAPACCADGRRRRRSCRTTSARASGASSGGISRPRRSSDDPGRRAAGGRCGRAPLHRRHRRRDARRAGGRAGGVGGGHIGARSRPNWTPAARSRAGRALSIGIRRGPAGWTWGGRRARPDRPAAGARRPLRAGRARRLPLVAADGGRARRASPASSEIVVCHAARPRRHDPAVDPGGGRAGRRRRPRLPHRRRAGDRRPGLRHRASVPQVDKILGPGNIFVALAKRAGLRRGRHRRARRPDRDAA